MGDASAVPEHLYGYSDRCTRGGQELQDWVRAAVTPALRAYEQGGGLCLVAIDHEVAVAVASAYYTDRDVRTVGHAFQVAGGHGVLQRPYAVTDHDLEGRPALRTYRMTDDSLDAYLKHQTQLDAGAALAKRFDEHDAGSLTWITQQLSQHANDPYFCAGFFNSLSANQIARLLGRRADGARFSNDDALVNALSSGAVTPQTAHNLQRVLGWVANGSPFDVSHQHISAQEQLNFLAALRLNPVASRNFLALLSPGQLHDFMRAGQGLNNTGGGPNHDDLYLKQLVGVLTAAQSTYRGDAAGMSAYMARMAKGMDGLWLDGVPHVGNELLAFVTAGITGSIAPLTGDRTDLDAIRQWAAQQGLRIDGLVAAYTAVLKAANKSIDMSDSQFRSVVLGVAMNFLPLDSLTRPGLELVFDAGHTAWQSWVSPVIDEWMKDKLKEPGTSGVDGDNGTTDLPKFVVAAFQQAGGLALVKALVDRGAVVDSGGHVVKLPSDPKEAGQRLVDMVRNPDTYAIRGHPDVTLYEPKSRFEEPLKIGNENRKSTPGVILNDD